MPAGLQAVSELIGLGHRHRDVKVQYYAVLVQKRMDPALQRRQPEQQQQEQHEQTSAPSPQITDSRERACPSQRTRFFVRIWTAESTSATRIAQQTLKAT